jgi:histidine kinase-like protein
MEPHLPTMHPRAGAEASARFKPEPAAPRQARRFVTATLADWECNGVADDVELLTSELVTNAVLHAGSPVKLTMCRMGGGVRVEVADEDPDSLERALRQRGQRSATTGRGLELVRALAGHWGVIVGGQGKSVWFEMATGFGSDGGWVPTGGAHTRRTTTTRREGNHG